MKIQLHLDSQVLSVSWWNISGYLCTCPVQVVAWYLIASVIYMVSLFAPAEAVHPYGWRFNAFHHVSHVSPVPSWSASPVVSRNQCPLTRPRNWPPCPVHNCSLSAISMAAVYKCKQLVGSGSANDLIMSFNRSMSIKTRIWGLLVRVMVCTVERAEVQSVFCACCGNEDVPNTCAYRLIFWLIFQLLGIPQGLPQMLHPFQGSLAKKAPLTYGEATNK